MPSLSIENLGAGAFLHDEEGTILDVNRDVLHKLGYLREELIGQRNFEDVDVGRNPNQWPNLWEQMNPGETTTVESIHRRKDGSSFPVELRIHCFEDQEKRFSVLARDITDTKQQVDHLQDRGDQFETLFEMAPIGLWEEDWSEVKFAFEEILGGGAQDLSRYFEEHPGEKKEILEQIEVNRVNTQLVEMFEAPSKQALQRNFEKIIPQSTYTPLINKFIDVWKGKNFFRHETELRTFQGEDRKILRSCKVVPGHEEEWDRVFVSYEDVTELSRTREKLREQAEFLDAINDHLPGVIFQMVRQSHDSYHFSYLSEGFENLIGVPSEEVLENFEAGFNTIHPGDRSGLVEAFESSADYLDPIDLEVRHLYPDGSIKWGLVGAVPERIEGAIRWSGITLDITERKKRNGNWSRRRTKKTCY